jgi:hypothetical protein
MDVSERYEQLIAYLNSNLPAPVEEVEGDAGARQFFGGDPVEVVVRLTDTSVTVSEFSAIADSPYGITARPRRVGVLNWRRLPENALLSALASLIKGARDARLSSYQACQHCGHRTAPECLDDNGVCQACTDQHTVVH